MECNDEDRIALDENARKTLEELRTDCPFCVEKVKEFMGISSTTIMSMPDPNAAINYIFNFNWDCPLCEKNVKPDDVFPLSPEMQEVEKYEKMGHKIVFHQEYDAYLNYTLEKKISLDCGDENCEFCNKEIDWKKIKEAYL
tara:strand:- start:684 stop:1106 length:423 start_codon:yes stop_codon:yes gene_type:complete